MSNEFGFVEATSPPICPHCDMALGYFEYQVEKLSFGTWGGFTWVIILTCPSCHRILGTQTRD